MILIFDLFCYAGAIPNPVSSSNGRAGCPGDESLHHASHLGTQQTAHGVRPLTLPGRDGQGKGPAAADVPWDVQQRSAGLATNLI